MSSLLVSRLSEHAVLPVRGSNGAAGYDLASAVNAIVPARGMCMCATDLQLLLPEGTYGRIAPRSGLALKHSIDTGAGVIDPDYTGNVGVILFNHGYVAFQVTRGDRIAQLILEKIEIVDVEEVPNHRVQKTARGSNGFGSTGSKSESDLGQSSDFSIEF